MEPLKSVLHKCLRQSQNCLLSISLMIKEFNFLFLPDTKQEPERRLEQSPALQPNCNVSLEENNTSRCWLAELGGI